MILAQGLCKSIGQTPVLTDVTFHLEAGECLALLGANGSGKSQLLQLIATLTKPTAGSLSVAGYDAVSQAQAIRPLIGYVPAVFEGYDDLSPQAYLEFFASAYKLPRNSRAASIQDVLALVDLTALRQQNIGVLSFGQRLRLCFAKAFLHDASIWLLDNALASLDPQGRTEMAVLIQELGVMGKTVVLATNHLSDVTAACQRVGVLHQGRLVFFGGQNEIQRFFEGSYRLVIRVASDVLQAQALVTARDDVNVIEVIDSELVLETQMEDMGISNLLKGLFNAGVHVVEAYKVGDRLPDLFTAVTSRELQGLGVRD